jgi:uncharacterized protein
VEENSTPQFFLSEAHDDGQARPFLRGRCRQASALRLSPDRSTQWKHVYVGHGQGDRVFSHAAGRQKTNDPEETEALKLKTIWKIKNAGFEVEHIIHRHGLNEMTAKEVESALIDAYPGLTNIQPGFEGDRGVMHAEEVIRLYEAPEAVFQHRLILINVNQTIDDTSDDTDLYNAVRYSWKISPKKATQADYVLAVRKRLIIGAFKAEKWLLGTHENFPEFPPDPRRSGEREGRWGFRGQEAPHDIQKLYLFKRVPERFRKRGAANPIRYVGLN